MPRVTGPLFSIAAHGSIGEVVTYRQTRRGAIAQHYQPPRSPASFAQASERARCSATAANWRTLPELDREPWTALAIKRSSSAWIVFFTESTIQQIVPPSLPLVPVD